MQNFWGVPINNWQNGETSWRTHDFNDHKLHRQMDECKMILCILTEIKHIQAAAVNSSVHAQFADCYFFLLCKGFHKLKKT